MATQITGITANLSLETAAFIRDLSKASQAVARNTSAMKRSFDNLNRSMSVIKGAAAGFISVATLRQMSRLGMAAIEAADDIGKASTALGIGAEELQRFRFAANQADVSTEELDNALKMFLKNASTGKFKAVGQDAADAFKNYIDQIAQAPTLLEKVNLAQKAFGRQYQTALLLAAQGADEFRRQFANANVVSKEAIAIASRLDNSLRQISNAAAAGFQTGFLEGFAGKLDDSTAAAERVGKAMFTLGSAMATIVTKVASLIDKVDTFAKAHPVLFDLFLNPLPTTVFNGAGGGPALPTLSFEGMNADLNATGQSALAAADGVLAFGEAQTKAGDSIQKTSDKIISQLNAMDALRQKQAEAAIQTTQQWLGVADTIGQALGVLFKENKAVAIAQAVINTAQAITEAMKLPFPINWAQVAAVTALGAAQIATIVSSEPGTSKAIKRGGGGGKSAPAKAGSASTSSGSASPGQAINITLQGESGFSRDQVRELITQINSAVGDGATLKVSG